MRPSSRGFTLVEVAIVLVIIGLLLGAVVRGQELADSARVKRLSTDFRAVPMYLHAFQDKYRALPGDAAGAAALVPGASTATTPAGRQGNGLIEGAWNSTAATDESRLFWQHVRLAGFAAGPVDPASPDYTPRNAFGGVLGISSAHAGLLQVQGMTGSYQVCSAGILGRFARQLDIQLDDGNTAAGSVRAVPDGSAPNTAADASIDAAEEGAPYTVCMSF